MEKRTWVKLIFTMLVIAGIGAGIYRQWYWGVEAAEPGVVWGTGRPGEAEKSYYRNRIGKIIRSWQNTRRDAERGDNARFKESYNTLLVIDIAGNAFWIEKDGRIQPEDHTALPSNMKWKFHRSTPQGSSELPGRTRLKMRGYNSDQEFGEEFHLVGVSRRGGHHIGFSFGSNGRGTRRGYGPYTVPAYSSSRKKAKDLYPSLVVTDTEYEEYLKKAASADPNRIDGQDGGDESLLAKNRASWAKVEKLIYQQIEREMLKAGCSLRSIEIEAGPDYSAGHARFSARTEGVFRQMFGGSYWGDIYLKIDLLGDDIWYASNAADPQRGGIPIRQGSVDVEFFICSTGDIPDSKRGELLEKGRKMQKPLAVTAPSKWKAKLANGAVVQFIGICENPSAGKKWWGPDGAPMDYVPYATAEAYDRSREDRNMYEMAWKVEYPKMPGGGSGGSTSTNIEGSMGSHGGSVRNRYGSRLSGGLRNRGYSFKKSRKKTTLKLSVRVSDGEYERVEFRNISLVRGEDQGFEVKIIPRNPPSKWKATLSNGAIVELNGICKSPTAGKKWWGADGTILDYPPLYIAESPYRPRKNKVLYEMTWNVYFPPGNDSTSAKDTKFDLEGSSFTRASGTREKYGDKARWSHANTHAFDKSQREVSAKIEVRVGNGEYEQVIFRNMSLVPGEDRGFKIETEKKE